MPEPAAATDRPPVSVLGLGAMGRTLARTLLHAGHTTTVWNRTPERAHPLVAEGAALVDTPGAALAAGDAAVVCVLDDHAVHDLLEPVGEQLEGRLLVNLTSSTPEEARATAAWARERGAKYLDGAIMVPTPLVGSSDALFLYSGAREVFDATAVTLHTLGGDAVYLGTDAGLASLHDIGLLDLYFAGLTGFLHAAAIVGADGVSAGAFLSLADRIVTVLGASLEGLARDVDTGRYPGEEDNLEMEFAAMSHIVDASRARGVDPALPELVRDLIRGAIDRGHGRDGFSRVVEQLRSRPG